jgi:inorganic pyrophosphatase
MHHKQLRALLIASVLAFVATPGLGRAEDWKGRVEHVHAAGFRFVPGNYAAGVPDSAVFDPLPTLNLYSGFAATNADGTVNAVIEIPAGDNRKWETDTATGRIFWELKDGAPRYVKYVGYAGNYGMVPRTLGGDGDPLDVITLGRMQARGTVTSARIVGVMRMIDGGDPDDKLIAVLPGTVLEGKSLADLDAMGITAILKTWFESYKGPGAIQVDGFGTADEAAAVLDAAIAAYAAAHP